MGNKITTLKFKYQKESEQYQTIHPSQNPHHRQQLAVHLQQQHPIELLDPANELVFPAPKVVGCYVCRPNVLSSL